MKTALRTASIISILSFLSKFVGILRDTLMAWSFGTSAVMDAYSMSNGISGVVVGLIGTTISTTALPLYSDLKINRDSEEGKLFLINLLNIMLIAGCVVTVAGWLFAEPLVRLFAGGYSGELFTLTVQMTRVSLFALSFQMVTGVFGAYLQSERKLVTLFAMNMPLNFFYIGGIFAAVYWHPVWLSWSAVAGAAFSALLYLLVARRQGFTWRPYLNLRDPVLRTVLRMMIPVWIGQSIGILNLTVDRSMASYLPTGSVSAMNYAQRLLGSAASLFIPPLLMLMAPLFAESAAVSRDKLMDSFGRSLRYLLLLVMPLTVGVIAVAEPTVRVLYGYGAFDEQAISLTAWAMVFYACNSFVLNVVYEATYRVYVSLQDTVTPLKISVLSLGVNIALNIALVSYLGIGGLALASSVATLIWVMLALWLLRRKVGAIGGKKLLRVSSWSLGASLLMLIPVLAVNGLFAQFVQRWQRIGLLGLSVALGALVYVVVISFSRIAEVEELKALIWEQIKGVREK